MPPQKTSQACSRQETPQPDLEGMNSSATDTQESHVPPCAGPSSITVPRCHLLTHSGKGHTL